MHFIVLGAGAIGCYVGGRLAAHGHSVCLVGRPHALAHIAAHGLRVTDLDGFDRTVPPAALQLAHTLADAAPSADATILLCVKSGATESAARELAAVCAPGTSVISLQNGVDNVARVTATAPGLNVLAGMVPYNVVLRGAHVHRATAGHLAAKVKDNQQLGDDQPAARQVGDLILQALGQHPLFMSAALPLKVLPPRFNRYQGGGQYGAHVDAAIFSVPGTPHRVRSDLSATLFFSEPHEYEGGELTVQDSFGQHSAKLAAGDLVLYPGTSLHHVTPVTRGVRLASFFWIQSLVRDDSQRALMLELDTAIQQLARDAPGHPSLDKLTGVYHNLLRQWANT